MLTGLRPKFALAGTAAFTSVSISFGYGKRLYDLSPEQLAKMPLIANVAGTLSVLAAAWSKTSFALTLLRISDRWMKVVIWILLVSLNIVMGASALMVWIKCNPIAKMWDGSLPGTCWPQQVFIIYYQFTAGMSLSLSQ